MLDTWWFPLNQVDTFSGIAMTPPVAAFSNRLSLPSVLFGIDGLIT